VNVRESHPRGSNLLETDVASYVGIVIYLIRLNSNLFVYGYMFLKFVLHLI
jgi:hypothetical protein